jgi:hypothetical protein
LQAARETAVENIKTGEKHDHREQLTKVFVAAVRPNQGFSATTTTPSRQFWHCEGRTMAVTHHPKTTTLHLKYGCSILFTIKKTINL